MVKSYFWLILTIEARNEAMDVAADRASPSLQTSRLRLSWAAYQSCR